MIRRFAAALLAAATLTAAPASGQAPAVAETIRYAGDRNFPPYEYIDANGQPAGFNIALMRQAAARAGLLVKIELGEWAGMLSRFDAGEFDVMMLGYSEARAQKYELRTQIWTLHQVVLIKPAARRAPQNLGQLATETVAVLRRSLIEELLLELPEVQRPTILPTPDQETAVRMIADGHATAAAGNSLTLKMAAQRLGVEDLQEIPVKSLAYYLAARRDNDPRVERIARAIDDLERDGELAHLIEEHLTIQTVVAPWRAYAEWVAAGVAVFLIVLTGVGFWNRSLTQQVRLRTDALQLSEARYRALVDNASDIIHETDAEGHFTFVNPIGYRVMGWDEGSLIGVNYLSIIRPDWQERVGLHFSEQARTGKPTTYVEFPVITRDGRQVWIGQETQPIFTSGQLTGWQAVARDVTQLVDARTELRRERDFIEAIVDTAASLVMVVDRDGLIRAFNKACEQVTGYAAEEMKGRPIWEVLYEGDLAERLKAAFANIDALSFPMKQEVPIVTRSGARMLIAWVSSALRGEDGRPSFVVAVGNDVTEARDLERMKDEFVSIVNHELRTPLTSLRGSLQLLSLQGSEIDEGTRDQLNASALRNTERLIRIVNDILDLSKIEAGHMEVHPKPMRPADAIAEAASAIGQFAADSRVTLESDVPPDAPMALGDADRTVQVLVNLMSNAVKFSPEGGRVIVSVTPEQRMLRFSVKDQGRGIPRDRQHLLFHRFQQMGEPYERKKPGTGLGLAIAKALVELQGGSIAVFSDEGRGSTFSFTLPLAYN